MPFSRARYVTLCQQSLVTATVLVVGLSAAGVKTLDIVPSPAPLTGAEGGAPNGAAAPGAASGYTPTDQPKSEVDTTPVTPKVREVKIAPRVDQSTASTPPATTPPATKAPAAGSTTAQRRTPQRVLVDKKPLVALSAPQKVTGFATIGVTWQHGVNLAEGSVGIQVRTSKNGRWSGWSTVQYHDDHGPDGDAGELTQHARPGTDAMVIGDVDQVQMRAENASGKPIPDLQLAVIDPGTGKMTKEAAALDTSKLSGKASGSETAATNASMTVTGSDGSTDTVAPSAMKIAAKPTIFSLAPHWALE